MSNTARKFSRRTALLIACMSAALPWSIAACAAEKRPAVQPNPAAREMRLMSYNIRHCAGADNQVDVPRVAEVIKREKPDFVGLNEVDRCATRSHGIDMPEELGRLTGLHATFAQAIPLQGGGYGNAVLSREKPLSVLRVPLPGREPRVLLLCEFKDFWFGTSHFALQATNQLTTAKIIRRVVKEKAAAKPVFITGDWNCPPDSAPIKSLREYMKVISSEKCRTFHGFKKHAPDSGYCIDYIAVDQGAAARVKVKEAHVTSNVVASDHNPVVVTIDFTQGPDHLH